MTLGILGGAAAFLATLWVAYNQGGEHMGLLMRFWPGYTVTVYSAFWGLGYGFIDGFLGGWVVAWLYTITVAGVYRLHLSGLPVRDGEHRLAGLEGPVAVRFDRWAVPHIEADSEADAAAALGYLHANDRLTQMELGRRAAFGRLAEVTGEGAPETDVYFRTLRLDRAAAAILGSAAPRSRRLLEAYAAGVNAWLAERGDDLPPALRLLGVAPEPWQPRDSTAFAILMAEELSFWQGRPEEERFRWRRAFGVEGVRDLLGEADLHLPPAILEPAAEGAPRLATRDGQSRLDLSAPGSNN